jgi:hypothetical protein
LAVFFLKCLQLLRYFLLSHFLALPTLVLQDIDALALPRFMGRGISLPQPGHFRLLLGLNFGQALVDGRLSLLSIEEDSVRVGDPEGDVLLGLPHHPGPHLLLLPRLLLLEVLVKPVGREGDAGEGLRAGRVGRGLLEAGEQVLDLGGEESTLMRTSWPSRMEFNING